MQPQRVLYFDIDGTINDYDDQCKIALSAGKLQGVLQQQSFDTLVCVSGWSTMVRDSTRNRLMRPSLAEQTEAVRRVIADAFPDRDWFLKHCELRFDNDDRGQHIDLTADWYYIDDWAREHFTRAHGIELHNQFQGSRLLTCSPNGDGSDVLAFLEAIPKRASIGQRI